MSKSDDRLYRGTRIDYKDRNGDGTLQGYQSGRYKKQGGQCSRLPRGRGVAILFDVTRALEGEYRGGDPLSIRKMTYWSTRMV